MCKAIEVMRNKAIAEEKATIALNLLLRGKDSIDEIADLTGLRPEDVQELEASVNANA